jgi:peroxiredoxin
MTTPARSFNKLEPGMPAPGFSLPAYPSGSVALDWFRGRRNVLLFFSGYLFHFPDRTDSGARNLLILAAELDRFDEANTTIVAISRERYSDAATEFARTFRTRLPLLWDADAQVGILYGSQALERDFAVNHGYDRSPILCLIDSQGIVQLQAAVKNIQPREERPLTPDVVRDRLWELRCPWRGPPMLSADVLLHLVANSQENWR